MVPFVPFPPNQSVDQRHWKELMIKEILPGAVKEQTQAGMELNQALTEMSPPPNTNCLGDADAYVVGCLNLRNVKLYPVFLWPWIEMRERGIPISYRKQMVVWLCSNCRQLERDKRKTAWVRGVVAKVHRSPSSIRPLYEQNRTILKTMVSNVRDTQIDLFSKLLSAVTDTEIKVGEHQLPTIIENLVVNIDTTQIRTLGIIHIKSFDESLLS